MIFKMFDNSKMGSQTTCCSVIKKSVVSPLLTNLMVLTHFMV